jgi:adsorption protein B
MHDSEDVIHPLSLKVYNYMIPRKDMVQLPVFPLTVNLFNFVHWIYNDEFIENHLNYMLIREVIGGHVPSAGVGTALSRNAIMTLNQNNNGIFPVSTHTEDYSLSLQIHRLNLNAIFMTQTIEKIVLKKKFIFFGKQVYRTVREHVVTRSLFPTTYWAAVRQRSRWTYGISLQEWQHSHWKGKSVTKLTFFRDRKGLISNFIAGYGYLVFLYWAIIWALHFQYPTLRCLNFFTEKNYWVSSLLFLTVIFMLNRILQRAIATSRIYWILPGLLSIPRAVVGNIINLHSTYYSLKMFFGGVIKKKATAWNKTKNVFPTNEQLGYQRHRLGDWLVHKGTLSIENLKQALKIQQRTHEKIGVILLKNRWITKNDFIHTLTEHGLTHEINWLDHRILMPDEISHLSRQDYLSLIQAQILPISSTPYSMHFVVHSSLPAEIKFALRKKYYPLKIYFSTVDSHIIRVLGYRFYLWIQENQRRF